jgi:hypothetical protein
MQMVVHEDIGIDAAACSVFVDGECEKVLLEISGIFENDLFLVTPNDDVVEGSGKLYAGFAGHEKRISNRPENVNVSSFHA